MSEKCKQILEIFAELLPKLTPEKQNEFLAYGEGMAFMVDKQDQRSA